MLKMFSCIIFLSGGRKGRNQNSVWRNSFRQMLLLAMSFYLTSFNTGAGWWWTAQGNFPIQPSSLWPRSAKFFSAFPYILSYWFGSEQAPHATTSFALQIHFRLLATRAGCRLSTETHCTRARPSLQSLGFLWTVSRGNKDGCERIFFFSCQDLKVQREWNYLQKVAKTGKE